MSFGIKASIRTGAIPVRAGVGVLGFGGTRTIGISGTQRIAVAGLANHAPPGRPDPNPTQCVTTAADLAACDAFVCHGWCVP